MQGEVNTLFPNGTWTQLSQHGDGFFEHKAQLIAKGFNQRSSFNYIQTHRLSKLIWLLLTVRQG